MRSVSPQSDWQRFVERRRNDLRDEYPCAMPTYRRFCRRHEHAVGPVTRICKDCRDELYERLAREYLAAAEARSR